jgi:hypothetical protein
MPRTWAGDDDGGEDGPATHCCNGCDGEAACGTVRSDMREQEGDALDDVADLRGECQGEWECDNTWLLRPWRERMKVRLSSLTGVPWLVHDGDRKGTGDAPA